jgi:arylsulfatase A-like enzyme
MLGERGLWNKSYPFEASIRVPLVVAGPGVSAGQQAAVPIELIDLAATFVEVAGATPPTAWDAQSLRPLLVGDTVAHRHAAESALGEWRARTDGRWKLVEYQDGTPPPLLYHLETDPFEHHDVSAQVPAEVARLGGAG